MDIQSPLRTLLVALELFFSGCPDRISPYLPTNCLFRNLVQLCPQLRRRWDHMTVLECLYHDMENQRDDRSCECSPVFSWKTQPRVSGTTLVDIAFASRLLGGEFERISVSVSTIGNWLCVCFCPPHCFEFFIETPGFN